MRFGGQEKNSVPKQKTKFGELGTGTGQTGRGQKSHQILFLQNKTTFFVTGGGRELPLVGLEPTRLLTSVPKTDTSTIPPQRLKY